MSLLLSGLAMKHPIQSSVFSFHHSRLVDDGEIVKLSHAQQQIEGACVHQSVLRGVVPKGAT